MQMHESKLETWIQQLSNSKPYRITLKKGQGFHEVLFWYGEYHFHDKLTPNDMNDELKCQKKVLDMCRMFEQNIHLKVF